MDKMILALSFLGIFILLILDYSVYKKETEENKIKQYIKSVKFCNLLIELIIIILGATIAIDFSNMQEKKANKEKTIALLEAAEAEIQEAYNKNELFISEYDNKKIELGELKFNSSYNISTLSKILDNDMVIVTLTPLSYRVLCNALDNVNTFNSFLLESDVKDENIYTYVKAANSHLEEIIYEIDNEIQYLEGNYSEKSLEKKYQSYIESKYTSIDNKSEY